MDKIFYFAILVQYATDSSSSVVKYVFNIDCSVTECECWWFQIVVVDKVIPAMAWLNAQHKVCCLLYLLTKTCSKFTWCKM